MDRVSFVTTIWSSSWQFIWIRSKIQSALHYFFLSFFVSSNRFWLAFLLLLFFCCVSIVFGSLFQLSMNTWFIKTLVFSFFGKIELQSFVQNIMNCNKHAAKSFHLIQFRFQMKIQVWSVQNVQSMLSLTICTAIQPFEVA